MSLSEKQITWTRSLVDERLKGMDDHDWFVVSGRDAGRRESLADAVQAIADERGVTAAVVCVPNQCRLQVATPADMVGRDWTHERYEAREEAAYALVARQTMKQHLDATRIRIRDGDVVLCRSPVERQRSELAASVASVCEQWDIDALTVQLSAAQALDDLDEEALEAFGWTRATTTDSTEQ